MRVTVDRVPAVVAIVLAAALWGTTGTSQALGPDIATPLGVGLVRLVLGAVGLVLVAWAGRTADPVVDARHRPPRWSVAVVVGGVAIGLYQWSFFVGVDRLGVAIGTLVGIGSAPLLTGLAAALVDRDLGQLRYVLVAAPVPLVGIALLVAPDLGVRGLDLVGMLAALGAGASYGAYTLAARRLLDDGETPRRAMARLFVLGAAVLAVVAVAQDELGSFDWVVTPRGLAMAAWLGVAATTLAYVLFGHGLRTVAPARVATLTLTEPLVATLLGVALLGERLGVVQVLGVVVVLVGLAVAGRVVVDTTPDPTTE